MTQQHQQTPQVQLVTMLSAMSDPNKRNSLISQVPQNLQRLFTDREYQYELIGRDQGTQAFVDLQNHLIMGTPMPESSAKQITQIREKLMGMVETRPAVV